MDAADQALGDSGRSTAELLHPTRCDHDQTPLEVDYTSRLGAQQLEDRSLEQPAEMNQPGRGFGQPVARQTEAALGAPHRFARVAERFESLLPVYVLQGDRVVSEVWPKEELGLEGFQHIHNAVLKRIDDRFYILVQAWNPGDFAVLEQVLE